LLSIPINERGPIFCNHSLHVIRVNQVEVSKVHNDLPGGPIAWNRRGIELFIRHTTDGTSEYLRTEQVLFN
jgi:hypothetical protein